MSHHIGNATGIGAGIGLFSMGVVTSTPILTIVGVVTSLGMLAVGVSREIRCWKRGPAERAK